MDKQTIIDYRTKHPGATTTHRFRKNEEEINQLKDTISHFISFADSLSIERIDLKNESQLFFCLKIN